MATHYIADVVVTGTADSPQTINYADLVDVDGTTLESSYASAPVVGILGGDIDQRCYLPSRPGTSSFTIARHTIGAMTASITVLLRIETPEPASAPDGYGRTAITIMTGKLGAILRDPKNIRFPIRLKVEMLNTAQEEMMAQLMQPVWSAGLLFLEQTAESQSLSSDGEFNLKSLDTVPFRGPFGLHPDNGVQLTGGKFCTLMSSAEYKEATRRSFSYNENYPRYRIQETSIFVYPHEDQTIDLRYLRAPATMQQASVNVNCEFIGRLADIIIGLACEEFQNETPAAAGAFAKALKLIRLESLAMPQTRSMEEHFDFLGPEFGDFNRWPDYDDSNL